MASPPRRGRPLNRGPSYPELPALGPSHTPRRPLWLCRRCAQPWPCGEARVRLIREYADARTALRIYLATCMHEAIRDLLTLNRYDAPTAAEFFARFLAWVAPGPNR